MLFTPFEKVCLTDVVDISLLIVNSLTLSLRNTGMYFLHAFHSRLPFVLLSLGVAYSFDSLGLVYCHFILYVCAIRGEICLHLKFRTHILYNFKTKCFYTFNTISCTVYLIISYLFYLVFALSCHYLLFKPTFITYSFYLALCLSVPYFFTIIFLVLPLNYYGAY